MEALMFLLLCTLIYFRMNVQDAITLIIGETQNLKIEIPYINVDFFQQLHIEEKIYSALYRTYY